jgi:hypothetical protein
MLLIPNAVFTEYVAHLTKRGIPVDRFSEYKKWLRYFLDFSFPNKLQIVSLWRRLEEAAEGNMG